MTQQQALAILKTGANVFLTGEPGSGKTFTVNQYIRYLRQIDIEPSITASTGIAATHLGGFTIHSWSGLGIKKTLKPEDLDSLTGKDRLVARLRKAKVLIIDEVSMIDAKTLTSVDQILRRLRESDLAFGGIQVILVGDFFQLPPVDREQAAEFSFLSPAWEEGNFKVCYLTEQHRQNDDRFLKVLNWIRSSENLESVGEILSERIVQLTETHDTTRLYSHNLNVNAVNDQKLQSLSGKEYLFLMESYGLEILVEQLIKGCLSPQELILKEGALVMFTKNNFEEGFVNGTIGTVLEINKAGNPVVVTKSGRKIEVKKMDWTIMDGDRVLAMIKQLPLRLAWAMTVHKSQGVTLDSAVIDLSNAFEYGQGYVAISRVRSLTGLYLLGINRRALEVHPKILEIDQVFRRQSFELENEVIKLGEQKIDKLIDEYKTYLGGFLKVSNEISTYDQSLELIKSGVSLTDIAKKRDLTLGTIIAHVEKLVEFGKLDVFDVEKLIPSKILLHFDEIEKAWEKYGTDKVGIVHKYFDSKYSYEELRLSRVYYQLSLSS